MKNTLFIVMACILTACSTHHINTLSSIRIKDFGQDIKVVVIGGTPDISNQLSRHIQALLLKEGFNIVNDEHATNLTVAISVFKPGNAALRIAIGYGAGRGSLVYNAKYSKADKVLIDYNGAERFTGLELEPGTKYRPFPLGHFAGEKAATHILLEEASKHIVELAELPPVIRAPGLDRTISNPVVNNENPERRRYPINTPKINGTVQGAGS